MPTNDLTKDNQTTNHQFTLSEMGIVVVGQNHNPSILNPDFLWRNRIVHESMPLAESNNFSTPLRSHCAFQNGLRIMSELDRIAFTVPFAKEHDAEKNRACCIAAAEKYLRVVPLVQYVAVGVNFTGSFAELDGELTTHNMLKTGEWCKFEGESPVAEVTLLYKLGKRDVNLTIKHANLSSPERNQAVTAHGNFHHAIQAEQRESNLVAIAIVGDWENDLDCFNRLTVNIHKGLQK